MALVTKTVSATHLGIAPFNLSGTDYYDVTFTDNVGEAQVYSDGTTGDAYVTTDTTITTVPTAGASTSCLCLPTGMSMYQTVKLAGSVDTVRILSSGTPRVGVQSV